MVKVESLVPYARNARTHSDEQVAQLCASIKEWGWTVPILLDEEKSIIAGHGRVMAARKLGLEEVPAMTATGWTEAQRRAYVLADNKLALNAGWDDALLAEELRELDGLGFDLDLTGFDTAELDEIGLGSFGEGGDAATDEPYSRKIEPPIYEITGDRPAESELVDLSRVEELRAEIASADLPDEVRAFLNHAADRHATFNFTAIAEYYAHAEKSVQALMEASALVIIDFDQAIERGFVKLNKGMMEQMGKIAQNAAD